MGTYLCHVVGGLIQGVMRGVHLHLCRVFLRLVFIDLFSTIPPLLPREKVHDRADCLPDIEASPTATASKPLPLASDSAALTRNTRALARGNTDILAVGNTSVLAFGNMSVCGFGDTLLLG